MTILYSVLTMLAAFLLALSLLFFAYSYRREIGLDPLTRIMKRQERDREKRIYEFVRIGLSREEAGRLVAREIETERLLLLESMDGTTEDIARARLTLRMLRKGHSVEAARTRVKDMIEWPDGIDELQELVEVGYPLKRSDQRRLDRLTPTTESSDERQAPHLVNPDPD